MSPRVSFRTHRTHYLITSVNALELLRNYLCPVWRIVVDYYNLPFQATMELQTTCGCIISHTTQGDRAKDESVLLFESPGKQPNDDWQILSLVVGWKNDRVLVSGGYLIYWRHVDSNRGHRAHGLNCAGSKTRFIFLFGQRASTNTDQVRRERENVSSINPQWLCLELNVLP